MLPCLRGRDRTSLRLDFATLMSNGKLRGFRNGLVALQFTTSSKLLLGNTGMEGACLDPFTAPSKWLMSLPTGPGENMMMLQKNANCAASKENNNMFRMNQRCVMSFCLPTRAWACIWILCICLHGKPEPLEMLPHTKGSSQLTNS